MGRENTKEKSPNMESKLKQAGTSLRLLGLSNFSPLLLVFLLSSYLSATVGLILAGVAGSLGAH